MHDTAAGDRRASKSTASSIEKGLDRQLVLYWYQSHGRVVASEYWGKIYSVVDAIRLNRTDAALVRVIAPVRYPGASRPRAADKARARFVQTLFPHLRNICRPKARADCMKRAHCRPRVVTAAGAIACRLRARPGVCQAEVPQERRPFRRGEEVREAVVQYRNACSRTRGSATPA